MIVKTILAGGVADRDGRLKSGDHILQIGDVSTYLQLYVCCNFFLLTFPFLNNPIWC